MELKIEHLSKQFKDKTAVNTNRNDCCNHFRDPKRIPDANGPEKPAE